ncbi:MAG: FHA domain-containing protein [Thermotaleaceae bacterium]
MFNILSLIFRYLFILIIYLFIFGIIRLIYLDIKSIGSSPRHEDTYLKLINRKDTLPFKIKESYPLVANMIIGRKNGNDIVIKDPYISNEHAQIIMDEGNYFLEDMDSANGTFLNDEKIMDVVKLRNGDRLRIGQVEFLYVSKD